MKKFLAMIMTVCMLSTFSSVVTAANVPQPDIKQSSIKNEEPKAQTEEVAKNKKLVHAEDVCPAQFAPPEQIESSNVLKNVLSLSTEYAISGTISMPSGVSSSVPTTIWVYAYTPCLDSTNKVLQSNMAQGTKPSVSVTIPAGSTSANYSLSVNSGKYIIEARVASSNGTLLSAMVYYNSTGTKKSEYTAEVLNVTTNLSGKNLTLVKATRSITGRISMPSGQVAPTGGISYGVSAEPDTNSEYLYTNVTIPAGQSYADYAIGATESIKYVLYFSSQDGVGGYYDGTDTLKSDWNSGVKVDLASGSQSNINVTIKMGKKINVKINLEKALTVDTQCYLSYYDDASNNISGKWIYGIAGNTQISSSLAVDDDLYTNIKIGYCDITGFKSVYIDNNNLISYYSAGKGITSKASEATPINVSATSQVIITEPSTYSVSGTATFGSFSPTDDSYIYAVAEFENGAKYYTHVKAGIDASSVNFSIKVPQYEIGNNYRISVAANSILNTINNATKAYYSQTLNLSGNMSGYNITLNNQSSLTEFSGRFSLPIAAPSDGLVVDFIYDYQYQNRASYYIPEGQSYIDYKVNGSLISDPDQSILRAHINNPPKNIIGDAMIAVGGTYTGLNFSAAKSIVVKGRLSIPAGDSITSPITGTIYVNPEEGNTAYYDIVIPAGSTYADYEVSMPMNSANVYVYFVTDNDVDSPYISETMYYSASGSTYNNEDRTLFDIGTVDVTGIDITLIKGKSIGGVITLPENAYITSGTMRCTISAYNENYGSFSKTITISANFSSTNYRIVVPLNWTSFKLGYNSSLDYENPAVTNIYIGDLQYLNGAFSYGYEYSTFDLPENGIGNFNLVLPYSKYIVNGNLQLPSGLDYSNVNYISIRVAINTVNTQNEYSDYFSMYPTENELTRNFTISVPQNETDTEFYVTYRINNDSGVGLTSGTLYVNKNGSITKRAEQADKYKFADNDNIEITPSVGNPTIVASNVDELQSAHPYADSEDCTWVYSYPGDAEYLDVTFSPDTSTERNFDYIYIIDGNDNQIGQYCGDNLANQTIRVPGKTVKIRLTSDSSSTYYGFRVTNIATNETSANWGINTVSKNESILQVDISKPLSVNSYPTLVVGIYDENNKLLKTMSQGTQENITSYTFDISGVVGSKAKVFLWNDITKMEPLTDYAEKLLN